MATAYTSLLGFALPVTGELSGTWGDTVNDSITKLVEDSIAGSATASVASGDWTLTTTGSGQANQARCAILIPTGSSGVARNIIAPSSSKAYIVDNQSNVAVTIKGAATTGVAITAGARALVAWNGSDFVQVGGSGNGDVTGPASSTDNAIARFDSTTGKIIQNSSAQVDDSGNVLSGAGTVSAPAYSTTGDTNTGIFFPAADTIAFAEGGAEAMRLNSSGNLLVNQTAETTGGKIDIQQAAGGTGLGVNAASGETALIYLRTSGGGTGGQINSNSALLFGTSNTERMRIDSSGNVGIGTSSPGSKLEVAGATIRLTNSSAGNTSLQITASGQTAGSSSFDLINDASVAYVYNRANTPLVFGTNNTERARISAAGGFSVGTTADPGAGAIYATGNITAYYSDSRLKDVKGNITGALDKVTSLNGVYYTNNDVAAQHGYTSQDLQVGLLAQQVEAVLPEVVKAAPFDLDENGNSKSGENYKTVQYERIIPLLVEAIKELRAEVKTLKGE